MGGQNSGEVGGRGFGSTSWGIEQKSLVMEAAAAEDEAEFDHGHRQAGKGAAAVRT